MKRPNRLFLLMSTVLIALGFLVSASAQTADDKAKAATIMALGSSVRWEVSVPHAGSTLIISAPDGRVFRKEFKGRTAPEFNLSDNKGERLPDGQYTYELRIAPLMSEAAREVLNANRGKDDDPEDVRATRKRIAVQGFVESGSFSILNGAPIVPGSMEEPGKRAGVKPMEHSIDSGSRAAASKTQQHHALMLKPDDVIPDDLIVQGSACVGLDCVNGEVFGFDTIRLKENNTRLQFEDTSAAGFPLNNWQIRANSSAAGGASFLAFVDQGAAGNSETGTIVFEVDAGAPANSMKVASTGRVGLRTATPALDVHANTSDTPAIRLEQNNSGGFTAQTWDMAGNEANFFVRDVTGGSRLPFRIRPGAPTSSVDIAASGNVGIGFASPELRLDARVANTTTDFTNNTTYAAGLGNVSGKRVTIGYDETNEDIGVIQSVHTGVGFKNLSLNPNSGNVGIATTAPTDTLSVNGTASKPGGGAWAVFSDERLKNVKGNFTSGLDAVMRLQPLRYEYKKNNALGLRLSGEQIGFGAHAVQQVIPEAVTKDESGFLKVNNDPILWTMLNAIKEQQKQIEQLQGEVRHLRKATRRHH